MRKCTVCDTKLTLDNCHKRTVSKDGLADRCKSCESEYHRGKRNTGIPQAYKDPCNSCVLRQKCIDEKLLCKALREHWRGAKVFAIDKGKPSAAEYDKEWSDRSN